MENYLPLLQKSPLFASMEPQQITSVLHCVGAVVREAGAGEYILRAGERTQAMGLLLSGSAFAVQNIWTFKACKKLLKSYRSADRMLSWSSSGKFIYTAMAADGKKKERTSGYWLPESMEGGKMTLVGYAIGNTTATCLKAIIDTAAPADAEVEIIPLELPSNPD